MKTYLLLILLLFNCHAWATPTKILIIPFENATFDKRNDTLETGVPEILTVCFSNSPDQIIVLDRSSLDATLIEQSLSWEKYVNQQSMQSIGQVLSANFILRGSIIQENNKLKLHALLFDIASTKLHHSISGSINLTNLVKSICKNIAQPLVKSLHEKTSISSNFENEEIPEKQQHLIDGLNHYYNGKYGQSFAYFLKLVNDYPDDATSHYWLAQSFYQAGLYDFATIQSKDFIDRFPDNSRFQKMKSLLIDLESRKQDKGHANENK